MGFRSPRLGRQAEKGSGDEGAMAKKKKRRQLQTLPQPPHWQWFTFPVLVGFTVGGATVLALVFLLGSVGISVAFTGVIGLSSFALAHIFTRILGVIIVRRRAARLARQRGHSEGRPRPLPPI